MAGGGRFASHRGKTLSSGSAKDGSPWTSQEAPTSTSNTVVNMGYGNGKGGVGS